MLCVAFSFLTRTHPRNAKLGGDRFRAASGISASSKHRARCALRTCFALTNTRVDTNEAHSNLQATDTPRQQNEHGPEAEAHFIQRAASTSQTICGQVHPEKDSMPSWRPSNVRLRDDCLHWQALEGTYRGVLMFLTRSVRCQRVAKMVSRCCLRRFAVCFAIASRVQRL